MRGVRTRLPQRAGMRDHVAFVVDATGYIVFDGWKLAGRSGRPLRSRLVRNLLEIVELALQPVDPGQQLALRELGRALGLMSKLSEARSRLLVFSSSATRSVSLRKRASSSATLFLIVNLALQLLDPFQQWKLRPADKLGETLFNAIDLLDLGDAIPDFFDRRALVLALLGQTLAKRIDQGMVLRLPPLPDP
jgi:hypothetical protein